jgi:hypothetical protein
MSVKSATAFGLTSGLEPGLVLLNTTNFSAQSTVSVSNFTSASYSKYRVLINFISSTDATNINFRFRENATDKATSYYGAAYQAVYTTSVGLFTSANNAAQCVLTVGDSTSVGSTAFDFFRHSDTQANILGLNMNNDNGSVNMFAFSNVALTNVTGFSIYPSAGNITGKVSVYGYSE